nr:MAG TPA: Protein of unknown function (DUF551) [Caudoviricetes sp.]
MNRLTQKRVNGIKTGYWSAGKKDDLVARLAEYEDTGLEPREVLQLKKNAVRWIPVTERLPDPESYILVSFENFSLPDIATYRVDEDGSGAFYPGDEDYTYLSAGVFVNAWMPLPEAYKAEMEEN